MRQNFDVDVTAGDLAVEPKYQGDDVSAMQLTACAWTARARHTTTNTEVTQFHFCDLPPFVNLAPGEYEVKVVFAANSSFPMADPQLATVTAGAVTTLNIETSAKAGIVTGAVTLNGQPANDLTICVRNGDITNPMPVATVLQQCGRMMAEHNGRFKFLAPGGAGVVDIRDQSGNVLLHTLSYTGAAGETTDVGTIAVTLGDLAVKPKYQGQDLPAMQLTACAWTARARHTATNNESTQFHFCDLPRFVNVLTGEYEVKLVFAANSSFPMADPQPATVNAGALTTLNVETSAKSGLVTGAITLNGQLANNLTVCVRNGDITNPMPVATVLQQCGRMMAEHNGRFRFLAPGGAGIVEIRDQSGNVLLHTLSYTGAAGETTDVGTIAVALGDLAVKPKYQGQDLPAMQLTACAWTARARHTATNNESTQFHFCDLPRFVNVLTGEYEVKLVFAANSSFPMADPQPATVNAGALTTLDVETSAKAGLVIGRVILNGQPGTNLTVCVRSGDITNPMPVATVLQQCGRMMPEHNGLFKFLVPNGCGAGTVHGLSFNLLATFEFCTEAGQETDVGNPLEPKDDTPPVITPIVAGTLGSNGWYTSDVTVTWSVVDEESAITSAPCAPGSVTTNTTGVTFTCSATSAGGSASETVTIKRDASPPVIVFSGNAGTYTVDQTVAITCSASDGTSGIAMSTCPSATGDAFEFAIGPNTLSASAADNAGNSSSASATFTVEVTYASLCALVERFVSNHGVANSLCVKLRTAAKIAERKDEVLRSFTNEVQALSGKLIPADKATLLVALATSL